jgi:hypothetical protein
MQTGPAAELLTGGFRAFNHRPYFNQHTYIHIGIDKRLQPSGGRSDLS